MGRPEIRRLLLLLALLGPGPAVQAGEAEIVERLAEFMTTGDLARQASLVRAISADPAWEPARLGEWLERSVTFEPFRPGRHRFDVALPDGQLRPVLARVPRDYDTGERWPLLVVYHAGGTDAGWALDWMEQRLGRSVERFVLVAPDRYRQTGIDAPAPFTGEQARVLDAAVRRFAVDPDRVHVAGYSLGGYTAWHLATVYGDRLAGAISVAATLGPPLAEDGVAEALLGNLSTPLLNVWGGADRLAVPGVDGVVRGTIAVCNRRLRQRTEGRALPVEHRVIAGRGHGDVRPRRRWLLAMLGRRRGAEPDRVDHRFRHLFQGRAAWAEATRWRGTSWGETAPPGGRFVEHLGLLSGRRGSAGFELRTRHVGRLALCLDRVAAEAAGPWSVRVNGRELGTPRPAPDLELALSEARRTRDHRRLCWARVELDLDAAGVPDAPHPETDRAVRAAGSPPRPCPC